MKEKRISSQLRREQIIDVAMKLFSRKGLKGTTVKDIAKEAGICEAMLYRHFDAKESLYAAILEKQCNEKGILLSMHEKTSHEKTANDETANEASSPEMNEHARLKLVVAEMITAIGEDTTFMRLFLFSCLEGHELSDIFFKNRIMKSIDSLTTYLEGHMKQGHFKALNAKLAARAFIGMIIHHVMVQELFGGKKIERFDLNEVADTFTTLFLTGIKQDQ